jgi:hypothetical protein|tara:strand:- start:3070 stop:3261 length:192 start_codon:yes stop_codon:yes gene_type:complete
MQKSKWHNISLQDKSFRELQQLQNRIPIRSSIPQVIEWLIKIGQKQINLTKDVSNENSSRIPK